MDYLSLLSNITEFTNKANERLVKIIWATYYILLSLQLTSLISKKIDFNYQGLEFTFSNVVYFFTSFQLIGVVFLYLSVVVATTYLLNIASWIIGELLYWIFIKAFSNKNEMKGFFIWTKVIDRNMQKGENYSTFVDLYHSLIDPNRQTIKTGNFIITTFFCTALVFPHAVMCLGVQTFLIVKFVNVAIWITTIYFFFNLSALKAINSISDTMFDVIIDIEHGEHEESDRP